MDTPVTTYLCFIPSLSSFLRGKVPKTEDLALVLIERLVPWPGEDCGKVCALLLGDRQKEEKEMLVKGKIGFIRRTERRCLLVQGIRYDSNKIEPSKQVPSRDGILERHFQMRFLGVNLSLLKLEFLSGFLPSFFRFTKCYL
jgi:hypothetical protein